MTGDSEKRHHLAAVFLRGIAMGAADIVPGVSGGTIAFITGIYFRLLAAINGFPRALLQHFLQGQFRAFWSACDGSFLVSLLVGILASIATLASLIRYLLAEHPILIWSFFFGLIVASAWHVARQLRHPRWQLLAPLVIGTTFAWWVTTLAPAQVSPSGLVFFAAGALAICAMILPGISGSFILVIIGMYAPVLEAIDTISLGVLALFVSGCVVGLLSVARLITWAFRHFHDPVLALLTGFMIGALNKVWPWKQTLSWRTSSSGEQVPLQEVSISPWHYREFSGEPSLWQWALLAAISGFLLVLVIEWLGSRQPEKRSTPCT